ncbi:MAG TPA: hypothetical protein VHM19_15475 [Polyangiales bacterium]|nr:hypothetical protein [Polyangiales bacterium]
MLAALSSCTMDQAKMKQESRDLLTRLNAIEDETSFEKRQKMLDELAALKLEDRSNEHAREVCLSAHVQLLRAEVEQATAKKQLEEADKGPGQPKLAPDGAKDVSAAIQRSNDALEEAQKTLPACEVSMQTLIARSR